VVIISKIYISDLDGTLLQNNGTLSDFSKRELTHLLNNGLYFTVASARSVVAMRKILADVPIQLPVIEFNGAFISDLATGRHEIINQLEQELVPEILHLVNKHDCIPFISSFNGNEDCLYYERVTNYGMQWYFDDRTHHKDKRLRHTAKHSQNFKDQIVCFTIIDQKEKLLDLAAAIKEHSMGKVEIHLFENQYSPGWYWLTVHDKRASKDQAIQVLLERLGISKNELTVFGDNSNDIKMFKLAGQSVAVSNATEELKQYASQIIGTNEEDSVVRYIMKNSIECGD
jgi:Cof subfamily protein (haloacid dehalogenase superfamily)